VTFHLFQFPSSFKVLTGSARVSLTNFFAVHNSAKLEAFGLEIRICCWWNNAVLPGT